MDDGAAAGVADEDHRLVDCVDGRHDRIDVVAQADPRPRCVGRLQSGQRERVDAMPRSDQRRGDLRPRGRVQPESGNQNDVHAGILGRPADTRAGSPGMTRKQGRGASETDRRPRKRDLAHAASPVRGEHMMSDAVAPRASLAVFDGEVVATTPEHQDGLGVAVSRVLAGDKPSWRGRGTQWRAACTS